MINLINAITLSRIILAPIILLFIIYDNYLVCVLLFLLAGVTDYIDGYMARKYNAESELGEILDPIADKILITFILIGLAVNLNSNLVAFLTSVILAREIGIGALRDYSSRKNLSHKTRVTFLAKTKTTIQLFTIASYLVALSLKLNLLIIISDILLIIATLITIYTGYQYVVNVYKK